VDAAGAAVGGTAVAAGAPNPNDELNDFPIDVDVTIYTTSAITITTLKK